MSAVVARWAVIGLGRVGLACAQVLEEAGALQLAWTRSNQGAIRAQASLHLSVHTGALPPLGQADVVLLAVPDDAIARVAAALVHNDNAARERVWLHTSGAHTSRLLERVGVTGARGSLHPLRSVSGEFGGPPPLQGSFFAFEGSPGAESVAAWFVQQCGGSFNPIDERAKIAYHAAAALASNGTFAILEAAMQVAASAGLHGDELRNALGALLVQSGDNARALGPERAMTGPVSRGDASTVHAHLAWLGEHTPALQDLYLRLGEVLLTLTEARGEVSEDRLAALRAVLASAEESSR